MRTTCSFCYLKLFYLFKSSQQNQQESLMVYGGLEDLQCLFLFNFLTCDFVAIVVVDLF